MLFVDNRNITDPRLNLAIEEHLLRNVRIDEPILLFYINEPSVIIGRNQNTFEEIDPEYVKAKGIHVVRRLSGGGAVYHDLGNLNFSFITPGKQDLHNFAKFTGPVIEVLGRLGVEAELRGRSDIFAAGKKISGNAQYATSGRMFSHGTLLFDTDLEVMLKALNPRQVTIESKAVQSVRSFVTNIRDLLTEPLTIESLKDALIKGIFGEGDVPIHPLADEEWEQIRGISDDRYKSWDWNYGRSPKFNLSNSGRFPAGKIDVRIHVEKGVIEGIKIYGDFTGMRVVDELEQSLTGLRYNDHVLEAALKGVDLSSYFGELEKADFLALLY
jgi:lipoate-protein ligase A